MSHNPFNPSIIKASFYDLARVCIGMDHTAISHHRHMLRFLPDPKEQHIPGFTDGANQRLTETILYRLTQAIFPRLPPVPSHIPHDNAAEGVGS
jgi:hypothetical protein